jgi:hypothetical protein
MDLRFRVDCVVFGVGAAVCTASLSLVSVLILGQKVSSFRHVESDPSLRALSLLTE